MSSRSRYRPADGPTPPPAAFAHFAKTYRCGHCLADVDRPTRDEAGVWHIKIHHDESCPVLAGHVDHARQGLEAAALAARHTRSPILYIGDSPTSTSDLGGGP